MDDESGAHPKGVGGGCRQAATLQIEIKKKKTADFKGLRDLPFRREQPLKAPDD